MSEWWDQVDQVEVKENKKKTTKTASSDKIGCWCFLIGLFLIIGSCSQMEDTGGSLKGWEKWGGGFLFGLLLCFFGVVGVVGVVAQLFIEGVKILRNGVKNLRK